MKNDFPRIHVPPEVRRKMIEIAREFRKVPTNHESQKEADNARQEILEELGFAVLRIRSEAVEKNQPAALALIRGAIQDQNKRRAIPSPHLGEGKGGG